MWNQAEASRWEQARKKKRARRKNARLNGEDPMDDSESNPEEVPEMTANLSAVALDGMDPDNSKELEKDKNNMQQVGRQRATRSLREALRKSMATGPGA
eukprot:11184023-Lingulodinium_polyedra.AAC.1